jgi:hypothetical protein
LLTSSLIRQPLADCATRQFLRALHIIDVQADAVFEPEIEFGDVPPACQDENRRRKAQDDFDGAI